MPGHHGAHDDFTGSYSRPTTAPGQSGGFQHSGSSNQTTTNTSSNNQVDQGFVQHIPQNNTNESSINSGNNNSSGGGHPGGRREESFAAPPNTVSVVNTTSWPGGYNQFDDDGTNIVVSDNVENTTIQTLSGTGLGGSGSKFQVNNTESVEVLTAVEELKRLNPGWSDRDALNYLEGGDWAMRKFTRGDLSVNPRSQNIKNKKKEWSTFGLGLRGKFETNVGVPTTRDNYGKMLDVMSGNWEPNSEMANLQKALLTASKTLKNPSKFSEYMGSMPSLSIAKGVTDLFKGVTPETFNTEKGSPGWMALAHRQAKRGELMPDNSNPLDSLIEFGNDNDKVAAKKYKEALRQAGVSKINNPMTWKKESNEERIERYKKLGYNINPQTGEVEEMPIEAGIDPSGLTTAELYSQEPYILDLESAFIEDPVNDADGLADALASSGAGANGVTSFYVNGNIIDINKPFKINKAESLDYLSSNKVDSSVYNPSTSTNASVDVGSGSSTTMSTAGTSNPVWSGPRDRRAFEWMFFGDTSAYQ